MGPVHIFTPYGLLLQDAVVPLPQCIKFKHIKIPFTTHHQTRACSKVSFSSLLYYYLSQ